MADKKSPGGKAPKKPETIEGAAEEVKKKKRVSPMEFLQQVRVEGIEKVNWTSWKETQVSTVMVFIMVIVMAIFFLIVDQTLRFAVCAGLQLSCGGSGA
ncbi:MAG TPA: preprotein translocase subunit SecE [Parvularcula sp.]|nr:preprotein translocase subunit SecE [Parvularcula sp.]HBS31559.1 preprotein translocase subunit SecE [Parvularcula sp.]HBS35496.1 preprotein translocase subunit SecE [Parvularcula sp.]